MLPNSSTGVGASELGQVELDALHVAGEVHHHQDELVLVASEEAREPCGCRDGGSPGSPRPNALYRLRSAIRRLIHHSSELGFCCWASTLTAWAWNSGSMIDGQVEALGIGPGEPGVAIAVPLHRRAHRVAVAQVDVVAHADLVAVVEDRGAGQREQETVHHLDHAPGRCPSSGAKRRRMPMLTRAWGPGRRRGTCSRAPRRSPSRA